MERTSHAGIWATRELTSCEETDTTNANKSGRIYIFEWKRNVVTIKSQVECLKDEAKPGKQIAGEHLFKQGI